MSTKVWYCANCGYEVNSRGRCHSCGERLVASPLHELESGPDDDEVGYRLDQWDDPTRARLIRLLVNAGVPHRFEEDELVILAVDEPEVDKVVARATAGLAGLEDEEAEAPAGPVDATASQELYRAAKMLRDDPTDMQADVALGEASGAVFAVDYLPDLDEAHMAAVGRVTRRLLGALGADEALEAEIRHEAEVLCRLIAPSAGPPAVEAEAERASSRLTTAARQKGRLVELPQSEVTPGGEVTPAALTGGGPEEGEAVPAQAEDGLASVGVAPTEAVAVVGDVDDEPSTDDLVDDDEDGTGEIVYELGEWLPEQRVELSLLLESAGIAYNWDGADLTVAEEHETEVEGLFEQVHGLVDDDDEARYRSIEELFGAVDRLANDPGNDERQRVFLEAVGAVELPTPVGVDDAFWWRVRSQGHALVAALEHDARIEEISREAALLAEMLHEMV
ncbi:MAG TPA: hypothetical protein VME20_07975 [Acidimicrobiales bacterium]|nr:hypothetical protein [Acidimicrobiales bacterium]